MIQLRNTTTQTIPVGGAVTFDDVILKTGNGECFNDLIPTSVKMRGDCNSLYDIDFGGNVTNETNGAAVQLSIAVGGAPIPNTARNAAPATAGDLWGIFTATYFRNCCSDMNRISVVNTGPNPVVLAPNACLRVARKA